ncbi:uncharacterized protein LOC118426536 [Branchiostoma floridae]|uniref:Uncharacterized protein LOC118426536 n=1 Tax=Branchiostoma floridae TaxID=7739 RepID=A0A9J7M0K9_BRAFL|nr:uncharacterized protein LOC118426536 [Branchiostoma floridae]
MKGTSSIIPFLAACLLSVEAVPLGFLASPVNETQVLERSGGAEARDSRPRAVDLIEAADASDPDVYQLRHTLNMDDARYDIFTKVRKDGSLEHQAAKVPRSSFESRQPLGDSSAADPLAEASEQLLKKELGDGIQHVDEEASHLNDTGRGPLYNCAYKVWNDTTASENDKMTYRVLPCGGSKIYHPASDDNDGYMTCEFAMDPTLRQAELQKAELYLPWLTSNKTPSNAQIILSSHDDWTAHSEDFDVPKFSSNPTGEANSNEAFNDEDNQPIHKDVEERAPQKEQPTCFTRVKTANDDAQQSFASADDTSTYKVEMYRPHRKVPFQFDARATNGHCGQALDILKMVQRWQRRAFDPASMKLRLPTECGQTENCIDGQCLNPPPVYLLIAYAGKVGDEKPATMSPEVMKGFLDIILSQNVLG